MPKLPHFDAKDEAYFVTTTTQGRRPVFATEESALILWSMISQQRDRGRFELLAFAIMPDHLHLIIIPQGATSVPFIMQEIKKGSARLINKARGKGGKLWMDEYYEHVVRGRKGLVEKIQYVHGNPVRKGLVETEEAYPFSSANPQYEQFLFKGW
jgi:putative transposase